MELNVKYHVTSVRNLFLRVLWIVMFLIIIGLYTVFFIKQAQTPIPANNSSIISTTIRIIPNAQLPKIEKGLNF